MINGYKALISVKLSTIIDTPVALLAQCQISLPSESFNATENASARVIEGLKLL